MEEQWAAVDRYLDGLLVGADPALDAALAANKAAGLPAIDVSPTQGKLLQFLAQIQGARRILEIGALGGYSTIWLARALPAGGRLITLEVNGSYAEVAKANVARAGLADRVELRLGAALETLPELAAEGVGPFDLVLIVADKQHSAEYFDWAIRLSRPGSLIITDNVIRGGAVIDPGNDNPSVEGSRRFLERLAAEPRVTATAIQTVGSKGHDGLAIALVTEVGG